MRCGMSTGSLINLLLAACVLRHAQSWESVDSAPAMHANRRSSALAPASRMKRDLPRSITPRISMLPETPSEGGLTRVQITSRCRSTPSASLLHRAMEQMAIEWNVSYGHR